LTTESLEWPTDNSLSNELGHEQKRSHCNGTSPLLASNRDGSPGLEGKAIYKTFLSVFASSTLPTGYC